jgi:hypothetical protein
MSEWRDIRTAPKDGSIFLAWDATTKRVCVGEWLDATEMDVFFGATIGFAFFDFFIEQEVFDHEMTHWQPLPTPPPQTTGE